MSRGSVLRPLVIACACFLWPAQQAAGQVFTEVTSVTFSNDYYSSGWWADYDGDGDLDVLTCGIHYELERPETLLWRREADGTFSHTGINFAGFSGRYCVAWGDFDADGDPDLAFAGHGGTAIYRNNGNNSFAELPLSLQGVHNAAVAWGDYDNDGDLDLLITGAAVGRGLITTLYRNDGGVQFADSGISFPGTHYGCVAWGDYDCDGDVDIAIGGNSSPSAIAKIYRNEGTNSFTDIAAPLPPMEYAGMAWGDYDNDGDLDLAVTGLEGSFFSGPYAYLSRIYRNDGGAFVDINASLEGRISCVPVWADYDADGRLDLVLTGSTRQSDRVPRLYRNTGAGFEDVPTTLPAATGSRVNWGDYDGDGDLDVLVGGEILRLYRNNSVSNAAPSAPSALTASIFSNSVRLTWAPSTDPNQSAALTYNLSVRRATGGVTGAMSDLTTGRLRVPQSGSSVTNSAVLHLAPGVYHWTVQSIDHGFAGSRFAPEQLFVVGSPWIASVRKSSPSGPTEITLGGQVGLSYTLESSSGLSSWGPLQTVTVTNGLVTILDETHPNFDRYFYRASTSQ